MSHSSSLFVCSFSLALNATTDVILTSLFFYSRFLSSYEISLFLLGWPRKSKPYRENYDSANGYNKIFAPSNIILEENKANLFKIRNGGKKLHATSSISKRDDDDELALKT